MKFWVLCVRSCRHRTICAYVRANAPGVCFGCHCYSSVACSYTGVYNIESSCYTKIEYIGNRFDHQPLHWSYSVFICQCLAYNLDWGNAMISKQNQQYIIREIIINYYIFLNMWYHHNFDMIVLFIWPTKWAKSLHVSINMAINILNYLLINLCRARNNLTI